MEQPTFQSLPGGGGREGGGWGGGKGGSRKQPLNRGVTLVLICAVSDGYLGPGGGWEGVTVTWGLGEGGRG